MKFKSILVVTYGRSGSTLLQDVLNALPNVLIRGENHDFCWGLYLAWKSLAQTKAEFGVDATRTPTSAWFGAAELDPEGFLTQARVLLRTQLGITEGQDDVCWGFKEIRYINHLEHLQAFLDFLSRLLPDVAIVFNTRAHDAVCDSAFWKKQDPAALRKRLQQADRIFLEYAERHEHAFVVRYERMILGMQGLAPLFEFLGGQPDPEKLHSVLRQRHSYAQKPETIALAARLNESSTLVAPRVEPDNFPCTLDSASRPPAGQSKVLVACVVKDERARLPWYLHHYRSLGCDEFLFIDNGSLDGTVEYLRAQSDVTLYHAPAEMYAASIFGTAWINELGPRHAMKRWLLLADADELLVWPGCEQEGMSGLITRAERMGLNRVFTPLIDVYPDRPCDELAPYESGRPFSDWCQWMDPVQHTKAFWNEQRLFLFSGPRMRFKQAGKNPPIMTKQKLYFVEHGGYQNFNSHFDSYGRPSPLVAPFLHYKFLADFGTRVEKAIAEGQHWRNAEEYRDYAEAALPSRSLMLEDSVPAIKSEDLRGYVKALGNTIRSAGMCGSIHWQKWKAA